MVNHVWSRCHTANGVRCAARSRPSPKSHLQIFLIAFVLLLKVARINDRFKLVFRKLSNQKFVSLVRCIVDRRGRPLFFKTSGLKRVIPQVKLF